MHSSTEDCATLSFYGMPTSFFRESRFFQIIGTFLYYNLKVAKPAAQAREFWWNWISLFPWFRLGWRLGGGGFDFAFLGLLWPGWCRTDCDQFATATYTAFADFGSFDSVPRFQRCCLGSFFSESASEPYHNASTTARSSFVWSFLTRDRRIAGAARPCWSRRGSWSTGRRPSRLFRILRGSYSALELISH